MISVSNIQRFATHDGPGIRTTVFLKGCYLHCPWCANPETWTAEPVLMHNSKKCVGCRCCEKACVNHAIEWHDNQFHWHKDLCQNCHKCIEACMFDALSMNGTLMKEEDVIAEAMKDYDYYEESNGGITFSGGEPFYQFDGLMRLLKLAKGKGLHTAVETTGNYPLKQLKEAEKYIDLFLYDVKNTDHDKLHQVTGGNPDEIFSNLSYLSQKRGKDVIVRVPVIPGFNEDKLEDIIACAKSLHVNSVNLLPYHNLGKEKWHQLGRNYIYDDLKIMNKEELSAYASDFVKIGG